MKIIKGIKGFLLRRRRQAELRWQSAELRWQSAELRWQAREILQNMTGAHWREEANKPDIELLNLLIKIGIAHLIAVREGEEWARWAMQAAQDAQAERAKEWEKATGVCLN